jgi:hypothetical protein
MTPETFFTKLVPDEWNRRLDQQLALGPEGAELAEKMLAVAFGLDVQVSGAGGGTFLLAVDEGRMRPRDESDPKRLLALSMTRADWEHLANEIGPSPMALLGGISGANDFVLTPSRLEQLRQVEGSFRLQVTGDQEWGLAIHVGAGDVPPEPATRISIGSEEYRALRAGRLDLQGAFLTGKLTLEGDVEAAMQLALAFLSPE